jgi:hypothetical protein
MDGSIGVDVALDLADIHVSSVLESFLEAVVLQDDGVEHLLEVLVRVLIPSIDAAMLVVELDRASNSLAEGEARGLRLDACQLVPLLLGDMLGHQAVGGLDGGEGRNLVDNKHIIRENRVHL